MFLSKLFLDPRSRDARRDLSAPYEMHRTLKRGFPEGEPEANRILFRIEPHRSFSFDEGIPVLVQTSSVEPDWTHLPEDYCSRIFGPRSFQPTFERGEQLAFRLHANPTVKRDGKRFGLIREESQREWLDRKAVAGGFTVLYAHCAEFRIGGRTFGQITASKAAVPHLGVRFDGMLQVVDPALFLWTMQSGIGSAKSFGFGLLSVAAPL